MIDQAKDSQPKENLWRDLTTELSTLLHYTRNTEKMRAAVDVAQTHEDRQQARVNDLISRLVRGGTTTINGAVKHAEEVQGLLNQIERLKLDLEESYRARQDLADEVRRTKAELDTLRSAQQEGR